MMYIFSVPQSLEQFDSIDDMIATKDSESTETESE